MSPSALRILVVDSEPQIGRLLKTVLGPKHDVAVAKYCGHGDEAAGIGMVRFGNSRTRASRSNGLVVIEEVRKISALPVIVLSDIASL